MVYNRYFVGVVLRVLSLLLTCLLFAYVFYQYKDILLDVNLIVFISIQVWLLIRYSNRINYELSNFFLSLNNDDASIRFDKKKYGKSFNVLYERMGEVNRKIGSIRLNLERQNQYFRMVTENINVGLIGIAENGAIVLYNNAASRLLGIPKLVDFKQMNKIQSDLADRIMQMKAYEHELFRLMIDDKLLLLSVKINDYHFLDEKIKIVSMQDIKQELDDQEIKAYEKLIRVLTHEIMNTVGPVTSTIQTIEGFLVDLEGQYKSKNEISDEVIDDIFKGVHIIKERSIGLNEFVKNFRSISLLPKPVFKLVSLSKVLSDIAYLMNNEDFEKGKITIAVESDDFDILADQNLLEQTFINIFKNAKEAGANEIHTVAFMDDSGNISITIKDDGKGIDSETIEKIFIPFYTTKEQGSGIGLSLSRQIIRLHNGNIQVNSSFGNGTTVVIKL